MRRAILALFGTVTGTTLLVSAKLNTAPPAAPNAVATYPSGTMSSPPGRTTTPTTTVALKNGSFVGAGAAATRYETITVTITVFDGKITAASGSCEADTGQSSDICDAAVRRLQQEVLSKQDADVDTVSGATYTSDAYRVSLQSALDEASA
jgi:uncharacterized protein with FMN-binding domain